MKKFRSIFEKEMWLNSYHETHLSLDNLKEMIKLGESKGATDVQVSASGWDSDGEEVVVILDFGTYKPLKHSEQIEKNRERISEINKQLVNYNRITEGMRNLNVQHHHESAYGYCIEQWNILMIERDKLVGLNESLIKQN